MAIGPGLHIDDPSNESLNLAMSDGARPLYDAVVDFIATEVEPVTLEFHRLGAVRDDHWGYHPGQLDILEKLKAKAREKGLWNFFLPDAETGEGLSNLDYAYIAAELGKNPIASESLNCSAPDTGNMEVLERVGTPEQKKQWLEPLLAGKIRSAYAMTEPDLASSDAKNIACRAERDGDEWVINGTKYYISGAGDPRCKIMITMVQTNPDGPPHRRQSQILVPIDAPGLTIDHPMHVFGDDDAPHGHMHLTFDDCRVPYDNILLGEGRGFEISQLRLGPGRIHHCMRSIGAAERAIELMVRRGLSRQAFGKPILNLGKNMEVVSRARIDIVRLERRQIEVHGPAGRQGDGHHGQRRGPGLDQRRQGDGAREGLPDHRRGHPGPRRHRRVPVDASRAALHQSAHTPTGRRTRRGAPLRGRPLRGRPLRRRPRRRPDARPHRPDLHQPLSKGPVPRTVQILR